MLSKDEIVDFFKLVNSHAKKELGQNFLINKNIIKNIVDVLNISEEDEILEIGPGLGALSFEIEKHKFNTFTLVEYDQKFVDFLSRSFDGKENITIIKNNILKEREFGYNKVIGNLPYYITSDIILKIALKCDKLEKAVFMVQKECYKRIVAESGKDYNALNILLKYLFDIKEEIKVGRDNFFPIPNVDSLVFSLTKKQEKNVVFAEFLYKIARICFQNRRKTIANNLSPLIKNKDELKKILEKSGLSESLRAEQLDLAQFVKLAETIKG